MGLSAYRFMYVMESFETAAGALLYYDTLSRPSTMYPIYRLPKHIHLVDLIARASFLRTRTVCRSRTASRRQRVNVRVFTIVFIWI
jgi:hypothetical protein